MSNGKGNHEGPDEEPYVVTRGKPPREHQFKPGQSGNPKGRPKGSKDMATLIEEELDRKIPVTISGKRTKLTKREALARQQVDKALKGDHKAFLALLAIQNPQRRAGKGANGEASAEEIAAMMVGDQAILDNFLDQQRGTSNG